MATINTVRKNHDAPNDLYQTHPLATESAILHGVFNCVESVWDCCDGVGGISKVLERSGIKVYRSDIEDYNDTGIDKLDFLKITEKPYPVEVIVMNPPFKLTKEFMDKACSLVDRVIMFNRVSFLETVNRAEKMISGEWPLTDVYFHSYRVGCAKGLDGSYGNSVFYAWYVFDKKLFNGEPPRLHWITKGK